MTSKKDRIALDILEKALLAPPHERQELIHRECQGDETLLAEVRSLLKSSDDAPAGFLKPTANSDENVNRLASPAPRDALIGSNIGQYRIVDVIAAGGMGTVYEARQDKPNRTVAVKILRPGLLSQSVSRRFDHESQILARLRHPCIAQVYEAGLHRQPETDNEYSYFAMEYVVQAKRITSFATDARLGIEERLSLFLDVCDGVHHGHQRGVIHRDIKPGNILVDGETRVKIIDFGVARTTDSDIAVTTMHTEVGQLIGTLQYMSPEQCAADPLDIDTRSDVYSLGAVLYELLTDRLPYDVSNMTLHAAARVICEQDAEPPSRFKPALSGGLEAIILKAMAKSRDRRYASVSDLTRDIQAFLRGEPIQARPPTPWQRITNWAMRHPKTAAAISSLFIVLAIVGGSTAVIAKRMHDLDIQPDHMIFDEDTRREALVVSRGNETIARWGTLDEGWISFAHLHRPPGTAPDAAFAIIGGNSVTDLDDPNGVNVYEISNGKTRLHWNRHVENEDLPRALKDSNHPDHATSGFVPQSSWFLDIFSERPGKELVVSFAHAWSSRMLAIYDFNTGEPLYRVWHNGGIGSAAYLSKPQLLLLVAEDARTKLIDMGYELDDTKPTGAVYHATYPIAVIAIKPELGGGLQGSTFISMPGMSDGIPCEWIRWLSPPWSRGLVKMQFNQEDYRVLDPATQLRCEIVYLNSNAVVAFNIEETGHEIESSRVLEDSYRILRGDDPPHSVFQLCDRLPPPNHPLGQCPDH